MHVALLHILAGNKRLEFYHGITTFWRRWWQAKTMHQNVLHWPQNVTSFSWVWPRDYDTNRVGTGLLLSKRDFKGTSKYRQTSFELFRSQQSTTTTLSPIRRLYHPDAVCSKYNFVTHMSSNNEGGVDLGRWNRNMLKANYLFIPKSNLTT